MQTSPALDVTSVLTTIRDYIRWSASQFNQQKLHFGHGTSSALDEAVALVLYSIHQPYDLSDTYFDATLTPLERQTVVNLVTRRIQERTPLAYLTHEALFAGLTFYVDERVLVPRSPIAELIANRFYPWVDEGEVFSILDMCTGSGCIAIACAYAFAHAQVDAVDLSTDALAVAKINVDQHHLQESVHLYLSDLFTTLPDKTYDIIVSNPPYVSVPEWKGLPAEFHHEPEMGFTGGETGLDLVIRILIDAQRYLTPNGVLIVEVGNSAQTLQDQFPDIPFYWIEFEQGGDGVFALTAEQLAQYQHLFTDALENSLCPETP